MARPRPGQTQPAGLRLWLTTAVGLLVLIIAGFSVGMLAGIFWEEPDLVFAYFAGDTEEVDWKAGAATAPAVDVAAAGDEEPVDPQIRRERERSREQTAPVATPPAAPAETPAVAAAPVGRLAVQVGAFGTSSKAESLANSLRSRGFPVYVSPGTKVGESRWRVRVGPLGSREQAEQIAERLKREEKLPTWILSEDAS